MGYWVVWPIVIVQIFAFLLMFVRRTAHPLNVPMHYWVVVILMIANIIIAVSFIHDFTALQHLYL